MKPHHDFVAERPLAQHCAELLPAALPERDLLADIDAMVSDIAGALAKTMPAVASGSKIRVNRSDAARCKTAATIKRLGVGKAHCLIEIADGSALLFSVDHRAVHALTDRAYGGIGAAEEIDEQDAPQSLPLSADLTLQQLEQTWLDALRRVLPDVEGLSVARRGSDIARLSPFRGQAQGIRVELSVEQEAHSPWPIELSACVRDFERFADCYAEVGAESATIPAPSDPMAEPFAAIPLPARAVLAETNVPLSRVSGLAVGDEIPIAIARNVPLLIGTKLIARGTIGTQNDCVALKISPDFSNL